MRIIDLKTTYPKIYQAAMNNIYNNNQEAASGDILFSEEDNISTCFVSKYWPEGLAFWELVNNGDFRLALLIMPEYKNELATPGEHPFKTITDSISSLLEYKNKKYGNSGLEPLQVFSGKSKLGTRMDDKLARIKNSEVLAKNDVADCIGYLVLICKENGWSNFDEFKD